jgi:hypothetical protein
MGCKGGFVEYAYLYYAQNKAMDMATYPYQATDGNCTYSKKKGHTNMKGFEYLTNNDPNIMI